MEDPLGSGLGSGLQLGLGSGSHLGLGLERWLVVFGHIMPESIGSLARLRSGHQARLRVRVRDDRIRTIRLG